MRSTQILCIALISLWGCGSDGSSGGDGNGGNAADAGAGGGSDAAVAQSDLGVGITPDMGVVMRGEDMGPDGPPPTGGDPDEGEPQPYMLPAVLGMPVAEADPGTIRGCGGTTVSKIRGWVVDRIGRPVAGAKAQLCIVDASGITNCLRPSDSDADGVYVIDIGEEYRCLQKAAFRFIKPGSGRAPMYCNMDIPTPGGDTRLTLETPNVLYAGIPAAVLPPLGDERMSRTVEFANGVELDVVPFDLVSPYAELGIRTVGTDERGLCFLEGQAPPTRLYAFTPDSTIYGEAHVRFPNEESLAAGTKVDISILGGLGCERNGEHIAEGAWTSIGTGTVREDGMMIEADEGTSLTCLTWIGYRPL